MSTIYGNALIFPSKDGGAKETWVLNKRPAGRNATYTIDFTSNGTRYSKLTISPFQASLLTYGDTLVYGKLGSQGSGWIDQAYRKLTFDAPPTGALLTWLQANGVKQPDDTAVQPTKALTITSNGTVSVTPDAPYDSLKKVDVTVNVASGGEEMVNVSFKDTNFNRSYTIYSYDENGNLFCVIDRVQLNSTPSVFTVAKRGFVITNNAISMGGNATDGLRFSGMTPVADKSTDQHSWGFIVTGDNPSLEVYDAS